MLYICTHQKTNAEVAQLVELQPSKLVVASSSLVFRSENQKPLIYVRGFFIHIRREVYPDDYREASSSALK